MLADVPESDAPAPGEGVLPAGFRFGVATAGFQVEGGFNGPGEPANNWVHWERAGRVEPSGIAVDFWNRYEDHLDRVVAMGCDAFRMSVEWARVEPAEGEIDDAAMDRYAAILDACHERGLEPLVTLLHFTYPAWLGDDAWLSPELPDRFAGWVDVAARRLASRCRHWVTINEINVIGLGSYLLGLFPPGRSLASADMWRALDHLLAAHVRGYEVLHAIDPGAVVTTNNASISVYELDRLAIDVLVARARALGERRWGSGWLGAGAGGTHNCPHPARWNGACAAWRPHCSPAGPPEAPEPGSRCRVPSMRCGQARTTRPSTS